MSFQKCPICNGTGQELGLGGSYNCSVCKGCRIIDTITGLPPFKERPNNEWKIEFDKIQIDKKQEEGEG